MVVRQVNLQLLWGRTPTYLESATTAGSRLDYCVSTIRTASDFVRELVLMHGVLDKVAPRCCDQACRPAAPRKKGGRVARAAEGKSKATIQRTSAASRARTGSAGPALQLGKPARMIVHITEPSCRHGNANGLPRMPFASSWRTSVGPPSSGPWRLSANRFF